MSTNYAAEFTEKYSGIALRNNFLIRPPYLLFTIFFPEIDKNMRAHEP